jgi:DNA-binding response OmpR family regulator
MKVLIHDERPDIPEFLLEIIVNHGYKAGIAKDGPQIIHMISDDRYDVVLTNGGYRELDRDQCMRLKSSSVFIIGITDSHVRNHDLDSKADLYLRRPFLISELWLSIEKQLYNQSFIVA